VRVEQVRAVRVSASVVVVAVCILGRDWTALRGIPTTSISTWGWSAIAYIHIFFFLVLVRVALWVAGAAEVVIGVGVVVGVVVAAAAVGPDWIGTVRCVVITVALLRDHAEAANRLELVWCKLVSEVIKTALQVRRSNNVDCVLCRASVVVVNVSAGSASRSAAWCGGAERSWSREHDHVATSFESDF
jgi:uncharacterized membrane protein YphA (DoxX/SURF4 family)